MERPIFWEAPPWSGKDDRDRDPDVVLLRVGLVGFHVPAPVARFGFFVRGLCFVGYLMASCSVSFGFGACPMV